MNKQRVLSKNRGKDTHVRDVANNAFTTQSSYSSQIIAGEILFPEPEPVWKQTTVTVKLSRGGIIKHVAYPNAFLNPVTGYVHGLYEGPYPGQMVAVGFENGNSANPFVVNRYPYQGTGNTLYESSYILPMSRMGFHNFDVVLGHFTGSYMSFNTGILPSTKLPGSTSIVSITDFEVYSNTNILLESIISSEVKSALTKVTGTTKTEVAAPLVSIIGDTKIEQSAPLVSIIGDTKIEQSAPLVTIDGDATVEINGNTKQFMTWTEFNTVFQIYVAAVNALFGTKLDGSGTAGTLVCDISTAKTIKTLTGG